MSARAERIRDGVIPVEGWAPPTGSAASFRYVDISSVDRETKVVTSATEIPVVDAPSRARQLLRTNDVLVSTVRPNLNAVAMVSPELDGAVGSTGFTVLRADGRRLLPRYLFHWVRTPMFVADMVKKATGASYPAVSDRIVLDSSMPMPELAEQRRIAEILDKADAIRRKRCEAIAHTDELLRSAFLEMFGDPATNPQGWPVHPLGEVAELFAGNSLPSGMPFTDQQGGYLLLKVGDMNLPGNEVDLVAAREWAESVPSSTVVAPAGAVVIPKRGGAIATNKKRILARPAALDPNLMAIAPGDSVSLTYLRQWFAGIDLAGLSNGSTVPQLNKKDLSPLPLPVPSAESQAGFAVFADRVREMRGRMERSSTAAEHLFSGLLDQAFSGRLLLRVQGC